MFNPKRNATAAIMSVALMGLGLGFPGIAAAQQFPEKSITIIVPFSTGSTNDTLARVVAAELEQSLGQAVVVQNRPGAGGRVGLEELIQAEPDGYTLLSGSSSLSSGQVMRDAGDLDIREAIVPVAQYSESPAALSVNVELPVDTLGELLEYAEDNPINYGTAGVGGIHHLSTSLFLERAGIEAVHVPYGGGGPAMTGLLGGEVEFVINDIAATRGYVANNQLKRLAVASEERVDAAPDTPTMQEAGVDFVFSIRFGLFAPAGTPDDVVQVLNEAVNAATRTDAFRRLVEEPGGRIVNDTPEAYAKLIEQELEVLGGIVETLGLKRQ